MSHWNHRVVRRTYPDGTVILGVHEAFCDSNGLVWGVTQDPVRPIVVDHGIDGIPGETVDDLKQVINWMLNACDAPILDYDKIPEEGVDAPNWEFDEEELEEWPEN